MRKCYERWNLWANNVGYLFTLTPCAMPGVRRGFF
ncbi:uncharacterized protein SOCEGT47_075630 [Sorangium cellulosum]|uniref:Uncharacterized protein n=1 Tax=Sorangium cellulosum TaxID=56 RepID=A0A4P2QC90_SORCE|nr:uncharacterized protein SOCEGT47_075630 [Sorangium cellulosum]